MYAINHAATALLIKKNYPKASMILLLISVQLVEILWVILTYTGAEFISISNGKLHLNYLPYSHSVFTGVILSLIAYIIIDFGYRNKKLALAIAVGILSHVVLDIVFHEKDIQLSPFSRLPIFGFAISDFPFPDFILEMAYGVFCWWYFKGNKQLLITIIVFNIIDLPMMLGSGDSVKPFAQNHFILPTIILVQIILTWYFVWRFSKTKKQTSETGNLSTATI